MAWDAWQACIQYLELLLLLFELCEMLFDFQRSELGQERPQQRPLVAHHAPRCDFSDHAEERINEFRLGSIPGTPLRLRKKQNKRTRIGAWKAMGRTWRTV